MFSSLYSQDYSTNDDHSQHASDAVTPDTLTSGATTPEPLALERDITAHGANQTDEELSFKHSAGPGSDFSTGGEEKEVDGERDIECDGQREDGRHASEDRDEEGGGLWRMDVDLDEGRTEDEEEVDDEEMKSRLYKLVRQSRLTYFTSADNDADKVGQSEGEWTGDGDEDVAEQREDEADGLTFKICQLEKEVRASQFSSTEDELDRVGVEEEEDGRDEELAAKVCRLANQINATQFSSTEDELDRAGRGEEEEEEAIDEAALWKLQAEKAVQAAQLRDLSSLVSASQFSSTEDELDRVGESREANDGGAEGRLWDEARGQHLDQRRRGSFGDLDVNMFDLRDETEERKTESGEEKERTDDVLESRTKDVQQDKTEVEEDRVTETEDEEKEEVQDLKESEERQETEAERTEEETKENQPEAKWLDKEQVIDAESDEEDAEFDRIISSMLMMTLEDMQGETLREEAAENGRTHRETEEEETEESVRAGRQSGFEDNDVRTNASEETGSAEECQRRGGNVTSESAVEDGPGGDVAGEAEGDISSEKETGDERDTATQEDSRLTNETPLMTETREAKQTCDGEEQEDGGGKVMMETKGDGAEGGCESKENDERLEEVKEEEEEEDADDMDQSSMSSLQEGLLSPEEIQIVRTEA